MYSNYGCTETFVYLDNIILQSIIDSGTIQFTRSMYELKIINKDIYEIMTKLCTLLEHDHDLRLYAAPVVTKLLMEVIKNPKGYNIFKESLKKKNSLNKLLHQINFVG